MPRRALCLLLLAAALGGCAGVAPLEVAERGGRIVVAPLPLPSSELSATWYLPGGEASALVLMQHGFSRRCDHLRESSRRLMQASLMVLCVDASMAGGNPALADELAQVLATDLKAPGGRALPEQLIVGGHSAGARFAVTVGAQLDVLAPQRLAGALLLDPVATAGFAAQLQRVSDAGRRPVLAVLAAPHGCNAQSNALPALREVQRAARAAGRDHFIGAQFGADSSHVDVEGEDSDWIGTTACGASVPANVDQLRSLVVSWATAMALGVAIEPHQGRGWHAIE